MFFQTYSTQVRMDLLKRLIQHTNEELPLSDPTKQRILDIMKNLIREGYV